MDRKAKTGPPSPGIPAPEREWTADEMAAIEAIEVTPGSGNVFADLGLPDADGMHFKAELVLQIQRLMNEKGLTQTGLGELVGLPQPKVSALLRGHFRGFSSDRLFAIINRLGRPVEVRIGPDERTPGAARTVLLSEIGRA